MGNEKIILSFAGKMWSVPTVIRDKRGSILYTSRFFIHKDSEVNQTISSKERELNKIIEAQQEVIKKLTKQMTQLTKQTDQQKKKLVHYENIIRKLR
jgi:uncharacterized coiled-coil protein SlyX